MWELVKWLICFLILIFAIWALSDLTDTDSKIRREGLKSTVMEIWEGSDNYKGEDK